jgi:hypothetical protein
MGKIRLVVKLWILKFGGRSLKKDEVKAQTQAEKKQKASCFQRYFFMDE